MMGAKGVRRIPVVNVQGLLIGIVTVDDLLGLLAGELGYLVKLIGRELEQEKELREAS
ncbi:MAG: CBS domain-containing protein [Gammaproteobacteria bacterium]